MTALHVLPSVRHVRRQPIGKSTCFEFDEVHTDQDARRAASRRVGHSESDPAPGVFEQKHSLSFVSPRRRPVNKSEREKKIVPSDEFAPYFVVRFSLLPPDFLPVFIS